jgi:hypothetical protein
MVQKQAANMRSQGDGFADDDPLAELARIVGFDQPLKRDPVVSLPQAPQMPQMGSADFNLEDELMREFEGYEASPESVSYAPELPAPESVVSRAPTADLDPAPQRRDEPRFDPEPSFYAEPEPVYSSEVDHYAHQDVSFGGAYQPEAGFEAIEPEVEAAPSAAAPAPEISFDLADELEFAVADVDVRPEIQVPPARPVQPEPPRLRLPLANFSAQPARRVEPEVTVQPPKAEPVAEFSSVNFEEVAPVQEVLPSSDALGFGKATFNWASGPVEPIPATLPVEPTVPFASAAEQAALPIETEPRAVSTESAPVAAPARTGHDEPDFGFAFLDDLMADEDAAVAPPAKEPVVARAVSDDEFDPFVDQEFDLQLDEIELDLSDLDVAPQRVEIAPVQPKVVAPVAPAYVAAPVPQPAIRREPEVQTSFANVSPVTASFAAPVTPSPVPAFAAPAAATAAVSYDPAPRLPAAPAADSIGFDPSEISEQDDLLETLSGMDVPDVPVAETRPVQPAQSDYDIDIDAELATLFEEPTAPPPAAKPVAAGRVAVAPAPVVVAPQSAAQPLEDFDAFEKALEEDLLSTMSSSGHFEPESRGHITIAGEGQGFRFRRLKPYLMAGTAAVLLLAGAGGLYAWLGSGAVGTLTSGEPQVIAADKTPVKIVPENPGGKSVPNQDKAVYDRVAGNGVEDPKQPSLISSEEEPVDVVQRTLIPENLPLEGESESMATPVGETADPRLLPDGQPQQAAAEDPATITPRKVRTMIVRPDGTLVAQEVPAEPAAATPAPAETAAVTQPASSPDAPVLAAPSVPSANAADGVKTVDTRVVTPGATNDAAAPATAPAAPAETAQDVTELASASPATVEALAAADTAATPAATTEPAAPATTEAAAPRAPIPTSRPADQPVNVVGTVTERGNLRPAQPAASAPAEPAAEVASATPAAATPAPAAAAPAGSYGIQIASLPSEADAQKSYRNLSSKFGSVLGGKPWEVRQADIPGKGTFYRVRIVAGSKADAVALCEQYRSAGGSCIVSR